MRLPFILHNKVNHNKVKPVYYTKIQTYLDSTIFWTSRGQVY